MRLTVHIENAPFEEKERKLDFRATKIIKNVRIAIE